MISYSYQLDHSISVLCVVGWYFSFLYSILNRLFCKQTVNTLIRRRIMRRLIWVCTACLCPTKRTLDLYGSNDYQAGVSLYHLSPFSATYLVSGYVLFAYVPQNGLKYYQAEFHWLNNYQADVSLYHISPFSATYLVMCKVNIV